MPREQHPARSLLNPLQLLLTLAALGFVFLAMVIPNRITWLDAMSFAYLPIDIFILGLALLVPGVAGKVMRVLLALLLAAGVVFRVADMVAFEVFSRPFNPVFDTYLLAFGFDFIKSSFGIVGALIAAVIVAGLAAAIVLLAFMVLARLHHVVHSVPKLTGSAMLAGLVIWVGLSVAGSPRASRYFYDQFAMHVVSTFSSIADLRDFNAVVNIDAYADVPGDSLFSELRGKDVLVVFVESYGRTLLDKAEYAQMYRPSLQAATQKLTDAGYLSRSAYLTSPTVGGISWLAHGTALSGLWIDSQVRYDSLMMSDRPSLVRLFQRAGWRTVGVMPAISLAWPEGEYFGYDQLYTAPDLNYRGAPYNYVTMPDQFTLSQFQKFERSAVQREPIMAEIALLSSHAPWTPVPTLIPWGDVGDGTVFN